MAYIPEKLSKDKNDCLECPKIVVFARTPSISRIAEDSSVIADGVSFILVDALYLAGEIINIGHSFMGYRRVILS